MKLRFTPTGAPAQTEAEAKGTRAIASVDRPRRPATAPAPAAEPAATAPEKAGVPSIVWILLALVVAGIVYVVLRGRA
jgi:hypothetical protein